MTYRFVRVVWEDAQAIALWTRRGDPIEPQMCETKGHLVEETDTHVIVAATISGEEWNAGQQIPRKMIVSLEDS